MLTEKLSLSICLDIRNNNPSGPTPMALPFTNMD